MTDKVSVIFNYANSDDTILKNLGIQFKQMRLNKNYTQKQLGELSGISRSAISDLENKGNGTMKTFVQLLRALEKLELLQPFISEASVSPLLIAKLKGKKRLRATGVNKLKTNNEEPEW